MGCLYIRSAAAITSSAVAVDIVLAAVANAVTASLSVTTAAGRVDMDTVSLSALISLFKALEDGAAAESVWSAGADIVSFAAASLAAIWAIVSAFTFAATVPT
jgi:hypothetical protein